MCHIFTRFWFDENVRENGKFFSGIKNEVNGIKEPPYYEAGDII